MKICLLSPLPLFGRQSGAVVRIRALASALATLAEVEVVAYARHSGYWRQQHRENFDYREVSNLWRAAELLGTARLVPRSLPMWLGAAWGSSLTWETPYDVVIAEQPWMWPIAKRLKTKTRVFSAHNVEVDWYGPQFNQTWLGSRARQSVYALEREAFLEADRVVVCTTADGERLQSLYGRRGVHVVPNGCDRVSRKAPGRSSAFVAGVLATDGEHSRQGLRALLRTPVPDQSRLLIAGTVGCHFRGTPRCEVLGYVPDLSSFWDRIEVLFNPVLSGSGAHLKIAEALGRQVPVVTTPFGARGFDWENLTVGPIEDFWQLAALAEPPQFSPPSWEDTAKNYYDSCLTSRASQSDSAVFL